MVVVDKNRQFSALSRGHTMLKSNQITEHNARENSQRAKNPIKLNFQCPKTTTLEEMNIISKLVAEREQ